MLATIVDTTALWQTILGAFCAGVGTTLAFSVGILGVARSAEANRQGHGAAAILYAGLAVLGVLATAGAIVVGVIVMTTKG